MDALQVTRRYFDAWNSRDPAAVAAAFVEGGTYTDPTTEPISGDAIARYVEGLLVMWPDLSFDVVSEAQIGEDRVAAQWTMRGTNTGPLPGGPPLGRTIALPGADFIQVEEGGVRSVEGYFDQRTMFQQMGLRADPMPADPIGPIEFGGGVYISSRRNVRPGAFAITVLNPRDAEEAERVRSTSQQIFMEMLGMKGFIATLGLSFGQRMFTISAWEDVTDPEQLVTGGTHRQAMKDFYANDFTGGGMLSIWKPERVRVLIRCSNCSWIGDVAEDQTDCTKCGEALPTDLRPI